MSLMECYGRFSKVVKIFCQGLDGFSLAKYKFPLTDVRFTKKTRAALGQRNVSRNSKYAPINF